MAGLRFGVQGLGLGLGRVERKTKKHNTLNILPNNGGRTAILTWGFPKTIGSLCITDHSIWGSISGPLIFANSHIASYRGDYIVPYSEVNICQTSDRPLMHF